MNVQRKYGTGAELVWKDRKRWLGMPLSFTRYRLVRKPGTWFKIFTDVGFWSSVIDEVNLYRICDITLHQSFLGKILNTGDITLLSNDESTPTLILKNIKSPYKIKEMISTFVEEQRKLHNVHLTEFHNHE